MRITKFGHSCIRIEHDGHTLVVDPGRLHPARGGRRCRRGADHPRAPRPLRARPPRAGRCAGLHHRRGGERIREDAPDVAERLTVVEPEQSFEAAGLPVRAVGELHAVIHPDLPRFHNSGYVVTCGESTLFHPGDALTPPGRAGRPARVVVSAPWMKAADAVDFARLVGAPRNLAIHDRIYSEAGLGIVDGHLGRLLPDDQSYVRLADGADLD